MLHTEELWFRPSSVKPGIYMHFWYSKPGNLTMDKVLIDALGLDGFEHKGI